MFNSSPFNTTSYNQASGSDPAPGGDVFDESVSSGLSVSTATDTLVVAPVVESISLTLSEVESIDKSITLSEDINIILEEIPIASAILSDLMRVQDSLSFKMIASIIEGLEVSSVVATQASLSRLVSETISLQDKLNLAFPVVVSNSITTSDSLVDVLKKYATITNSLRTSGVFTTTAEMNSVIALSVAVSAALAHTNIVEVLSDGFTVSEDLVELYTATESLLSAIAISDTLVDSATIVAIASEDILATLTEEVSGSFTAVAEEDVIFVVTYTMDGEVYQGYSYSPENYSVTEYDNFDFNSLAFFNNQYLSANSEGLYLLGGDMDEDEYITARVKTASMDFDTSNIKSIPKVYLGIQNDSSLILTVAVDGGIRATYQLNLNSQNLDTQMFDIGKGLAGRYWQFTLETKGNTEFHLDEIEIFPVLFGRKW